MTELRSNIKVESMKGNIEQINGMGRSFMRARTIACNYNQSWRLQSKSIDDHSLSVKEMQVQYELEQSELITSHKDYQTSRTSQKHQLHVMEA